MTHLCYLGHEDCFDPHNSERLADEVDWAVEADEDDFYAWHERVIHNGTAERIRREAAAFEGKRS